MENLNLVTLDNTIKSKVRQELKTLSDNFRKVYQGSYLDTISIEWSIETPSLSISDKGFTLKTLSTLPLLDLNAPMSLRLKLAMDFFVSYDPFDTPFLKFNSEDVVCEAVGLNALLDALNELTQNDYATMLDHQRYCEEGYNYLEDVLYQVSVVD